MIGGGDQIQQVFRSAGTVSMEGKEEISKLLLKLDAWITYEEAQEKKRKEEARRKKIEENVATYEMKLDMRTRDTGIN